MRNHQTSFETEVYSHKYIQFIVYGEEGVFT